MSHTNDISKLAAQNDPIFKFSGPVTATAIGGSAAATNYAMALLENAKALQSPLLQQAADAAATGQLNPLGAALARYADALKDKGFGVS